LAGPRPVISQRNRALFPDIIHSVAQQWARKSL